MIFNRADDGRMLASDVIASVVVLLVALPLCLGIATASSAPAIAGLIGGIVGGIVIGLLSGSHTSVSGPAAGLTAVVAAQIETLGSFEAFLVAVMLAGVFQIFLGLCRAGTIANYFPSSVIKGLLAAIGLILIFKQIPHLVGHDKDDEGEMDFFQRDSENTFSELIAMLDDIQPGAVFVGLLCIALLVAWDYIKVLKSSVVPAPLVVVVVGSVIASLFERLPYWSIESDHFVNVPVIASLAPRDLVANGVLRWPDFSQFFDENGDVSAVTIGLAASSAATIGLVASLETLLNVEAVDKLDPARRNTPPNRELVAQGVGNVLCGMVGGLPVTSVVVRSSVNISAGARSKVSTILHGVLLLVLILTIPTWLNKIPLACLAAILIMTGAKLASPKLLLQMWSSGWNQFLPFAGTVVAIVMTDLLKGTIIGLFLGLAFILRSNYKQKIRQIREKHVGGEVLRLEFGNQLTFLKRASLLRVLENLPVGTHVLLDARNTEYIDADILDVLADFQREVAPAKQIQVSRLGFMDQYDSLDDTIQYVDFVTRDIQQEATPQAVLQLLKDGNDRFLSGQRLTRDLGRQLGGSARGQHPLAVILSCIDSRAPVELIFDLGLGDIFTIRLAGNIASAGVLGSMEYASAVAGAKLVLVMGHTRCGAVTAAVKFAAQKQNASEVLGCPHLDAILPTIQQSAIDAGINFDNDSVTVDDSLIDRVAAVNVESVLQWVRGQSEPIRRLEREGKIKLVGGMYDVGSGKVTFFE